MHADPSFSAEPPPRGSVAAWILWAAAGGVLLYFFGILERFGPGQGQSALEWLRSTWNDENSNYTHAWLVAVLMGWLFWRAAPRVKGEPLAPGITGLLWLLGGVLLYIAAVRVRQDRVAIVSLGMLLLGMFHFALGWRKTRHLLFPLSMLAFMVPVPNLEQMTTGLTIIATRMAHHAGNLIGLPTIMSGNHLIDPGGAWGNWEIDEGCSGIRSLVALTLISYVYAMLVHTRWMERFVIFASSIPIAIVANACRVTSILIVARFNVEFAKNEWHDYSGFLSFAVALGLLMLLSTIMRHGIRALKPKVKVTSVSRPTAPVAANQDPY